MITVQHNQSLLDIAIQEYGSAHAAVLIAIENGLNLSDDLINGREFIEVDLVYSVNVLDISKNIIKNDQEVYSLYHNQSLFDTAIQYKGSALAAIQIAIKNGISLSDDLLVEKSIDHTEVPVFSRSIIKNFERNGVIPSTGKTINIATILTGVYETGVYEQNVYQ
jgi:hypothetical protein